MGPSVVMCRQNGNVGKMNFKSDLIDVVKHYFATEGISFEDTGDASDFAARYCEMRTSWIDPRPRDVHFSREIHQSLGKLTCEKDKDKRDRAIKAWRTVFYLRHLFVTGGRVTPHLSKEVKKTTSRDGLLWDYGMHHFHLCRKLDESGFIERSDYLLFAVVADTDVFFVDVRMHKDPEKLLWVRQDLLKIVYANWPELIEASILHGVNGNKLTDAEKKELRRKNINHVPNIGTQPVAPLGGGTNLAGGSVCCRVWVDRLLREVVRHEAYFYSQPAELRTALGSKGIAFSGDMVFKLVMLDSLDPSTALVESLEDCDCLSADLSKMGFAIVEAKTKTPIVVNCNGRQMTEAYEGG